MITIDSSVWLLALKRRRAGVPEPAAVQFLRALLAFGREVSIPAPAYQDVLAAAHDLDECERIEETLEPFPVLPVDRSHAVDAARLHLAARRAGIPVTRTECLTAAITIANAARLFTVNPALLTLSRHTALQILIPNSAST